MPETALPIETYCPLWSRVDSNHQLSWVLHGKSMHPLSQNWSQTPPSPIG